MLQVCVRLEKQGDMHLLTITTAETVCAGQSEVKKNKILVTTVTEFELIFMQVLKLLLMLSGRFS